MFRKQPDNALVMQFHFMIGHVKIFVKTKSAQDTGEIVITLA